LEKETRPPVKSLLIKDIKMGIEKKVSSEKIDIWEMLWGMLESYQRSFLFFSAYESAKARDHLDELIIAAIPGITRGEITRVMTSLKVWADYHHRDMCKFWVHLTEALEDDKPVVHDTHEGIDLQLYIQGLNIRNLGLRKYIPINFLGSIVKEKVVADLGCGGGFWSSVLAGAGASIVYAIDRQEIISDHFNPFHYHKNIIPIGKPFDELVTADFAGAGLPEVFFLSEVIHGKSRSEILGLFARFSDWTPGNFHVIVNELHPKKNPLFHLQMRLHTRGGSTYWPGEINTMLSPLYDVKSWYSEDWGPRHWIGSWLVERKKVSEGATPKVG